MAHILTREGSVQRDVKNLGFRSLLQDRSGAIYVGVCVLAYLYI